MKNTIVALKLRTRLDQISYAENVNQYCHTLKMQKKCSSYTKSFKKPFCCELDKRNFYGFHELVILQSQYNELLAVGKMQSVATTRMNDMNRIVNDIFFTYLIFFPFLLFCLLHILKYFKRGFSLATKFLFPK